MGVITCGFFGNGGLCLVGMETSLEGLLHPCVAGTSLAGWVTDRSGA